MKINIQALCHLNNDTFLCFGFIEIRGIEKQQSYISWQMFDKSGHPSAGKSRTYFLGKEPVAKDKILGQVITDIENFRVGRNRIFSDVKMNENELVSL